MKAEIQNFNCWIYETDPMVIQQRFKEQLIKAGFKVLDELTYYFQPQGFTCIYLLAESHFAVHTFPEHHKSYIELSSCNEEKYDKFLEWLATQKEFKKVS